MCPLLSWMVFRSKVDILAPYSSRDPYIASLHPPTGKNTHFELTTAGDEARVFSNQLPPPPRHASHECLFGFRSFGSWSCLALALLRRNSSALRGLGFQARQGFAFLCSGRRMEALQE